MNDYAMILQNKVIGILQNQTVEPYWPPDLKDNIVTAIPCDQTVELGMMYNPETQEFYFPEPKPLPEPTPEPEPQPTQLDIIQVAVEKSNSELRQEGAETVILELVERGIL